MPSLAHCAASPREDRPRQHQTTPDNTKTKKPKLDNKRQNIAVFCLSFDYNRGIQKTKKGSKVSSSVKKNSSSEENGSSTVLPTVNLRQLQYSPNINPLVDPQEIRSKRRYVRSGRGEELLNPSTGEVNGIAVIHQIEERDDAEFVKVFAAGVAAAFELKSTAAKVFQVVLDQYQRTPMSKGYADYVNLFWFDNGIEGRDLNMSEKTFQRGLKELIQKRFLYPKDSASYWTNPALFFKGDRVMFIKEYRRKSEAINSKIAAKKDSGNSNSNNA